MPTSSLSRIVWKVCMYCICTISFSICKVNLHLFPELLQTYFYKVWGLSNPGLLSLLLILLPFPRASFSSIVITAIDWITIVPVVIRISTKWAIRKWQSDGLRSYSSCHGPGAALQNQIHIFLNPRSAPCFLPVAWSLTFSYILLILFRTDPVPL